MTAFRVLTALGNGTVLVFNRVQVPQKVMARIVVGTFAVVAFGTLGYWLSTHSSPSVQPVLAHGPVAFKVDVEPGTAPLPERARPIEATVDQPKGVASEAMRREFEGAPNFAAFIARAILRPQEGGRFYAYLAYQRCHQIANVVVPVQHAQSKPMDPAQVAAAQEFTSLKQRCDGVLAQYQDEVALVRALSDDRGGKDILLPASAGFVAASSADAMSGLEVAKRTGDVYLVAVMLETNVEHYVASIGVPIANSSGDTGLYLAAAAAACEIAGTCTSAFELAGPCALAGLCGHSDKRDYLRSQVPPELLEQYEKLRLRLVQLAR